MSIRSPPAPGVQSVMMTSGMPAGVVLSVGDGLSVPVEVPVGVGLGVAVVRVGVGVVGVGACAQVSNVCRAQGRRVGTGR